VFLASIICKHWISNHSVANSICPSTYVLRHILFLNAFLHFFTRCLVFTKYFVLIEHKHLLYTLFFYYKPRWKPDWNSLMTLRKVLRRKCLTLVNKNILNELMRWVTHSLKHGGKISAFGGLQFLFFFKRFHQLISLILQDFKFDNQCVRNYSWLELHTLA